MRWQETCVLLPSSLLELLCSGCAEKWLDLNWDKTKANLVSPLKQLSEALPELMQFNQNKLLYLTEVLCGKTLAIIFTSHPHKGYLGLPSSNTHKNYTLLST